MIRVRIADFGWAGINQLPMLLEMVIVAGFGCARGSLSSRARQKMTGAVNTKKETRSGAAQSKWRSILEGQINIAVGIAITWTTYLVVLPLFGIYVSHPTIAGLVAVFTFVSVVRQYLLRRLFNWWDHG